MPTLEQDIETGYTWLKKEAIQVEQVIKVKIDPIAIMIVEGVKNAEADGILPAIAAVLNNITDGISGEVNAVIQAETPKVLSILLGIEDLPVPATPEQITAFENSVLTAIGAKTTVLEQSELWSSFVTKEYVVINNALNGATASSTINYAQLGTDLYNGYKDLVATIAASKAVVEPVNPNDAETLQREALK